MSTPLTEICQWAISLPAWEQETLRRLLDAEPFSAAVYEELAAILLGEKAQEPVDFSRFQDLTAPQECRPVLVRIANTTNVNALAHGQTIEFGEELTAIFGLNGAGKSGYSRVFSHACFGRGDRNVLPNLFDPSARQAPKSAEITILGEGGESTIRHDFQRNVAALAGFHVFDSSSIISHLSRENTLSFSPSGLSAATWRVCQ